MQDDVLLLKGIPKDYCNYNFDTLRSLIGPSYSEYASIKDIVNKWVAGDKKLGLFIYGKSGVGKTFIGCEIVKQLLEKRITARRVIMEDIHKKYFENWSIPDIVYRDEVLFVDDFGKGFEDNKLKVIDKLITACIKYRREKNLATIISTAIYVNDLNINDDSLEIIKDFLLPIKLPEINIRRVQNEKHREEFFK